MAEALLRHRAPSLEVRSGGSWRDGEPASPGSAVAMRARGLDLSAHRSRLVGPGDVAWADLVLGLARRHVREVALLGPGVFEKAFTLKELVRRGDAVGPRPAGEELPAWLARVGAGRTARGLLGDDPADDVADPVGRPQARYDEAALEIEALVERVVALAFPGL